MKKYLGVIAFGALAVLLVSGVAVAASNNNFEQKQAVIESKVEEGVISEETAAEFLDEMTARMEECEQTCDGTGPDPDRERIGQKYDIGGFGNGNGSGECNGSGARKGQQGAKRFGEAE